MQLISILQQVSIHVRDLESNFMTLTENWLKFFLGLGVKKNQKKFLEHNNGGDQILETPKFVSKAVSWKVWVSH